MVLLEEVEVQEARLLLVVLLEEVSFQEAQLPLVVLLEKVSLRVARLLLVALLVAVSFLVARVLLALAHLLAVVIVSSCRVFGSWVLIWRLPHLAKPMHIMGPRSMHIYPNSVESFEVGEIPSTSIELHIGVMIFHLH